MRLTERSHKTSTKTLTKVHCCGTPSKITSICGTNSPFQTTSRIAGLVHSLSFSNQALWCHQYLKRCHGSETCGTLRLGVTRDQELSNRLITQCMISCTEASSPRDTMHLPTFQAILLTNKVDSKMSIQPLQFRDSGSLRAVVCTTRSCKTMGLLVLKSTVKTFTSTQLTKARLMRFKQVKAFS